MLDPNHAAHLQSEVAQIRGLLLALGELDGKSDELPINRHAHDAVKTALHRATDDLAAVIDGYTACPPINAAQS